MFGHESLTCKRHWFYNTSTATELQIQNNLRENFWANDFLRDLCGHTFVHLTEQCFYKE